MVWSGGRGAGIDALGEAGQVRVQRAVLAAVLHDDDIAVAALDAAEGDAAVAGDLDGRALRGRVIDALVGADAVQHRVLALQIEVRADPGKLDWRLQKALRRLWPSGV